MPMDDLFKDILDDDEELLCQIKPNKKRFLVIANLFSLLFGLIFFAALFTPSLLGLLGAVEGFVNGGAIVMLVISFVFLLVFLVNILGTIRRYKNTAYAITNKRVLIRSGFIGVDYKAIDLSSIHSINVRVDFADKLVNPSTGSIYFASALDPIVSNGNGRNGTTTTFAFLHIDNPYEQYKKIKQLSDELKKGKKE